MAIRRYAYLVFAPQSAWVPPSGIDPGTPAGLPEFGPGYDAWWENGGWATVVDPGGLRLQCLRVREADGDATMAAYLVYQTHDDSLVGLDAIATLPSVTFAAPPADAWRDADTDASMASALSHIGTYLCDGELLVEDLDVNGDPVGTFSWIPFTEERTRVTGPTVLAPALWDASLLPLWFDAPGNVVASNDAAAVLKVTACWAPDSKLTVAGYDHGGGEFERAVWTSSIGPYSDTYGDDYHHA